MSPRIARVLTPVNWKSHAPNVFSFNRIYMLVIVDTESIWDEAAYYVRSIVTNVVIRSFEHETSNQSPVAQRERREF